MKTNRIAIALTLFAAILAAAPARLLAQNTGGARQGGTQHQEEPVLKATLTGAEVVGGAGSPRGWASATLTLRLSSGEVCYDVLIRNLKATNVHVHKAAKGANGPVAVPFELPADSTTKGCAKVAGAVVTDMAANPANYYVNVHTAEYPQGAIRGQLAKPAAARPQ